MQRKHRTIMALALAMVVVLGIFLPVGPAAALTTIPTTTISSATFSIWVGETNNQTVQVHRITAPWMESTVTWNSFAGSYDPAVIGSFTATTGWHSVDLTALVQAWASGNYPNYGIIVEQGNTVFTSHASSENMYVDYRPKLQICPSGSPCVTIQRSDTSTDDVADAFISQLHPDDNYGSYDPLYTGVANGALKQSLIQFDFSVMPPASLGDFVWNDLNHNGIQDAGEPGMSGQPVTLHGCAGDLIDGTTTDAYGKYLFSNLAPGSYYVQFVALADYVFSPKDQGTNDAADSDADASGKSDCTPLSSGQSNLTIDAGLYKTTVPDDKECKDNQQSIGNKDCKDDHSSNGDKECKDNQQSIGNKDCKDDHSSNGDKDCKDNQQSIGNKDCKDDHSSNGDKDCKDDQQSIGNKDCKDDHSSNGDKECKDNQQSIGNKDCKDDHSSNGDKDCKDDQHSIANKDGNDDQSSKGDKDSSSKDEANASRGS